MRPLRASREATRLAWRRASRDAGGRELSFRGEGAAIAALFRVKLAGLRGRYARRADIDAAVRAIRDEKQAALRAMRDRQVAARHSAREAQRQAQGPPRPS